jgi:hypothetical protein
MVATVSATSKRVPRNLQRRARSQLRGVGGAPASTVMFAKAEGRAEECPYILEERVRLCGLEGRRPRPAVSQRMDVTLFVL